MIWEGIKWSLIRSSCAGGIPRKWDTQVGLEGGVIMSAYLCILAEGTSAGCWADQVTPLPRPTSLLCFPSVTLRFCRCLNVLPASGHRWACLCWSLSACCSWEMLSHWETTGIWGRDRNLWISQASRPLGGPLSPTH